jgi:hypothetical protein
MTAMKRRTLTRALSALVVVLGLPALSGQSAAPVPSDTLFRNLILQRVEAHSRGDVRAYRDLLDEGFVHVDDGGKRRTAAEMGAIAQPNNSQWVLGKSYTRLIAPTLAIVECEVTELVPFGPRRLRMPLQETDVFVLRANRWLFLEHAETHVLDAPRAASVDGPALDDFVGRYEWWPGYQETFSRRGGQLYGQATGDTTSTPLLPATGESFFAADDAGIAIFVRGRDGKVSHELVHFPDGKVVVARKVE